MLSTGVPPIEQFLNPTLQALKNLGGSGKVVDINKEVKKIMKLTDEQIQILEKFGEKPKTIFYSRNSWARTYLKKVGLINNPSRGNWVLTESASEIEKIDPSKVIDNYFKSRRKGELEQVDPIEIYSCPKCGLLLDEYVSNDLFIDQKINRINELHTSMSNYLLSSGPDIHWIVIFNDFTCACGWNSTSVHRKRFVYDIGIDIEREDTKLIHIYNARHDFEGLLKGGEIKSILTSFFRRWNYLSEFIICCAPFISSKRTYGEWEWLTKNLSPFKYFIITRKKSKKLLKELLIFLLEKDPGILNEPEFLDALFDLDKFSETIMSPIWAEDHILTPANFHAKFYAGVFKDHVEILHSSYNPFYHENRQLETIKFSYLLKDEFLTRFLVPFDIKEISVPPDARLELSNEVGCGVIYKSKDDWEARSWMYQERMWDIITRYKREILA